MVTILEKSEYNVDFHPMVDFIEASPLSPSFSGRIVPFFDTMLVHQGEGSGTPTESHHTPSPEALSPSHTTHTSPTLPLVTTTSILTVTPIDTPIIKQYTRRTKIAQSSVPPTIADEPASPLRDVSQGEACPTDSSFIANQDRATIAKSSTLPHDSAPRVTSPVADEGNMQQTIHELTVLCTSLQCKLSKLTDKFQAQEGRSMDEGEAATERISDDSEEMETVLTSIDAITILASGVIDVPTGSGSIPTASTPAEGSVPTGSEEVPTASPVFAIATVVARELEEQLEKEDQRRAEQIARYAKVVRIYVKEELQKLPIERRVELISDLVKYQDNYTKIYKFHSQQRKPWTKKQKRDYYMAVIRNNLGWKVKDFRGMTFKKVEAKFNSVWKQMEDFIPMGSKEEAKRLKRKGLNLEHESAKKQKTSEEVPEKAMSPEEVTEEKVKEMMQLVPIEEVYAEALQVKHHIIDWKVYTEGQRSYWKITRRLSATDHPPNFMHASVDWKLYDLCGVHHVTSKEKEIFMLVEKDYPLRKGLALVMICYKLQVKNFSQMANDLGLKIYKIANSPRQQGD
nr:hypothetical protein [Tanacetum cinerariifolium]